MSQKINDKKIRCSPTNVRKGNTIKAGPDSGLHVACCLCSGGYAVFGFGCTPVLLDEVELTMVFGIKVADVAT